MEHFFGDSETKKLPCSTVHRLGGQLSEVEAIHVHGHILYVIYCKLCIKRSRISWIHHIFCYVVLLPCPQDGTYGSVVNN